MLEASTEDEKRTYTHMQNRKARVFCRALAKGKPASGKKTAWSFQLRLEFLVPASPCWAPHPCSNKQIEQPLSSCPGFKMCQPEVFGKRAAPSPRPLLVFLHSSCAGKTDVPAAACRYTGKDTEERTSLSAHRSALLLFRPLGTGQACRKKRLAQ